MATDDPPPDIGTLQTLDPAVTNIASGCRGRLNLQRPPHAVRRGASNAKSRIIESVTAPTLAAINPKLRRYSERRHALWQRTHIRINTLVNRCCDSLSPYEQGRVVVSTLP